MRFYTGCLIFEAGRGVFATANIRKGTVVETSPALIIPHCDLNSISNSVFQHYT